MDIDRNEERRTQGKGVMEELGGAEKDMEKSRLKEMTCGPEEEMKDKGERIREEEEWSLR